MAGGRGDYKKRQRIRRALMAVEHDCWLCLEPLDFDIAYQSHPDFVVIDEEVPVALGGDPLDRRNCHLVHRQCNAKKGCKVLRRGAYAKKKQEAPVPPPATSREW